MCTLGASGIFLISTFCHKHVSYIVYYKSIIIIVPLRGSTHLPTFTQNEGDDISHEYYDNALSVTDNTVPGRKGGKRDDFSMKWERNIIEDFEPRVVFSSYIVWQPEMLCLFFYFVFSLIYYLATITQGGLYPALGKVGMWMVMIMRGFIPT